VTPGPGGSGWVREGAWASGARDAGWWAAATVPSGGTGWHAGPSCTVLGGADSKIFQTDLKFSKFWLIQKVSSHAPKIGNKIWLESDWDEEQLYIKNFPQIRNGFGTKIQRTSMSWILIEIYWKFLELWISMKFGKQAPCYTSLQGKIPFQQKRIRELNSTQNGKFDWFRDSLNSKLYFWITRLDLGSYYHLIIF
jgi:hypothetical protein